MYQRYQGERKTKKLFKYYGKTQINEVLEKAKVNQRDHLIMLTLWRTGMRCDELTNLKKKDITDAITIRQGKGYKDRIITLDSSLGDLLRLFSANLTLEDKLFPLTNGQVRNIVHKYQREYDICPHTFRHAFLYII